jgi:predicted small secreted protein
MKQIFLMILLAILFGGCATWQGMKQDFSDATHWSKEKVNESATYIKEKTE